MLASRNVSVLAIVRYEGTLLPLKMTELGVLEVLHAPLPDF